MRHRMINSMGLGNPDPAQLTNNGSINKKFANDAIEEYFSYWEYIDFQHNGDEILIGVEPAYQYEKLLIISINENKNLSYIKRGKAWGPYGSSIVSTTKVYNDYKYKSKFVKFIDKWHKKLYIQNKDL